MAKPVSRHKLTDMECISIIQKKIDLSYNDKLLDSYGIEFYNAVCNLSKNDIPTIIVNMTKLLKSIPIDIETEPEVMFELIFKPNASQRLVIYKALKFVNYDPAHLNLIKELHEELMKRAPTPNNETPYVLSSLCNIYKECNFRMILKDLMCMLRKLYYSQLSGVPSIVEAVVSCVPEWFTENGKIEEMNKYIKLRNWDGYVYMVFTIFASKVQCLNKEILQRMGKHIIQGFASNNVCFKANKLFSLVIEKCSFSLFMETFFPIFEDILTTGKCNRTLADSINKFVLPACARWYNKPFYYKFFSLNNLKMEFKLTLLSLHLNEHSRLDALHTLYICVNSSALLQKEAFNLLCHIKVQNDSHLDYHIDLIKTYIRRFDEYDSNIVSNFTTFLRSLSTAYMNSNRSYENMYIEFFIWLFISCGNEIERAKENTMSLHAHLLYTTMVTLNGATQTRHSIDRFPANKNLLFSNLMTGKFNTVFESTGKTLKNMFMRPSYMPGLAKLFLSNFASFITHEDMFNIKNSLNRELYKSRSVVECKVSDWVAAILAYHKGDIRECKSLYDNIHVVLMHQYESLLETNVYSAIDSFPLFTALESILQIIKVNIFSPDELNVLLNTLKDILIFILDTTSTNIGYPGCNISEKNKAVEHTIVNIIKIMVQILELTNYPEEMVIDILNTLASIVMKCLKKKPVSFAIIKLEQIMHKAPQYKTNYIEFYETYATLFITDVEKVFIFRLGKLQFIYTVLKMFQNHEYFDEAVKKLFEVDFNNETIEYSTIIAAVLIIFEKLLADKNLKRKMSVYITKLVEITLQLTNSTDFIVKNAAIRTFGTMTTRLLGQQSENGSRQISAQDVFNSFPDIEKIMYDHLHHDNQYTVSKIVVLGFLAETSYINRMHSHNCSKFVNLKLLFDSATLGTHAVRAYARICSTENIVDIISDDIDAMYISVSSMNTLFYTFYAVELLCRRYRLEKPNCKAIDRLIMQINTKYSEMLKCKKCDKDIVNIFKMVPYCKEKALLMLYNATVKNSISDVRILVDYLLEFGEVQIYTELLFGFLYSDLKESDLVYILSYLSTVCLKRKYPYSLIDMIPVLVNRLLDFKQPSKLILNKTYWLIWDILQAALHQIPAPKWRSILLTINTKYSSLQVMNFKAQHTWIKICHEKQKFDLISELETNEIAKLQQYFITLCERGNPQDLNAISKIIRDLFAVQNYTGEFLYLLFILTIQLGETTRLKQFFVSLHGDKYLSTSNIERKNFLEEVYGFLRPDVLRFYLLNTETIRNLLRRLTHFITSYAAFDGDSDDDTNFYGNDTNKLAFVYNVVQRIHKLNQYFFNPNGQQ